MLERLEKQPGGEQQEGAVSKTRWPDVRFLDTMQLNSEGATKLVESSDVIHMAHAVYTLPVARRVLRLLTRARTGTALVLRFTAGASYYRAISSSAACFPVSPYIHHAIHPFLLADLKSSGWRERWRGIIERHSALEDRDDLQVTVDWCDAQYGEFSGDVVERYLTAQRECGIRRVPNFDFMFVLEKAAAGGAA